MDIRDIIERLVICGLSPDTAEHMCEKFLKKKDYDGLKNFVWLNEAFYDDRRQYAMEER